MTLSRRRFLGTAAAVPFALSGLRGLVEAGVAAHPSPTGGFGPLLDDPEGLVALPEGFHYRVLSRAGETMDDGFLVPAAHDGMGAFAGPDGNVLLVRNHEVDWGFGPSAGPFGRRNELLERAGDAVYDPGSGKERPALGGTTTLLVDGRTGELLGHRLSLVGTVRNCAGGITPWGSWLTCEETTLTAGGGRARDHGWVFEVPARWEPETSLTRPEPLTALGRFRHEAVAVDPRSGVVYLTEDEGDGLLYRFVPHRAGQLARGGRLQALALDGQPSADTRNWGRGPAFPRGRPAAVTWVDLEDVAAPRGDLRLRGASDGAARFARGEGIWWGGDAAYFACTEGGRAHKGQIFRLAPDGDGGSLELFIEPDDGKVVENADNLTVAPWGDLVVCEDGPGDDYLLGVTPRGELYRLAHDMSGTGEFAGPCFSPDGSILFVNKQLDGLTLAITGPWERKRGD